MSEKCTAAEQEKFRYILEVQHFLKHGHAAGTVMSSDVIKIHLPDGAVREVPAGTTPLDIANQFRRGWRQLPWSRG